MSKFDIEYYVMDSDGANNHPLLNWGSTSNAPFRKKFPIEEGQLELPLKIIFDDPYPNEYEMADLLTLGAQKCGKRKTQKIV